MEEMIAKRIIELRRVKDWTQQQLADRSGVSRSFISGLEKARNQPTVIMLKKIADAFGVSVDYFVCEEPSIPMETFINLFPKELQEFLLSADGPAYLDLAVQARDFAITPEILADLIEMVKKARNLSK